MQKDKLFSLLQQQFDKLPSKSKKIILGDLIENLVQTDQTYIQKTVQIRSRIDEGRRREIS